MRIEIKDIRDINAESFEQLFDTYYRGLCSFSLRFIYDHAIAEDIVQEVFCSLWRSRDTIVFDESCKAYLFRSVKNRCLDSIKHNKIVDRHHLEMSERDEVSTNFTWDEFVENEMQNYIDKSLNKLPENLKEVFILNKIDGHTAVKIAEMKGISQRTIEGQIARSIALLREYLKFIKCGTVMIGMIFTRLFLTIYVFFTL